MLPGDFNVGDKIRFTTNTVIDSTASINVGDEAVVTSISERYVWCILTRLQFKIPQVRIDFLDPQRPQFEKVQS